MPGKNYIKVTSILFIIGAVISIILYPVAGLLFGYATVETGESLGWIFVVVCLFYFLLAVLELIACVKGLNGCNDKNAAADLKKWGKILVVIALITGIIAAIHSVLMDQSIVYGVLSLILGLLLPALYTHGAYLNEKA